MGIHDMSSQTKQHTKKRARFRTELPADFKNGKLIRAKTTLRYFKKKSNVVSDYFDDQMIDIIKQQFDLIDADNSGLLDHDELKQLYQQLGFETTETEIQEMIQKCDKDKNGQVDFEEFLSALSEDNEVMNLDKLCDKEFVKYETESAIGKDLINAEGIFGVCKKFGVKMSLDECKSMIIAINETIP